MPHILRDMPYYETPSGADWRSGAVGILPHQIIAWIGVTAPGLAPVAPASNSVPAIFDTGYNDNLQVTPTQLWQAGLGWRML